MSREKEFEFDKLEIKDDGFTGFSQDVSIATKPLLYAKHLEHVINGEKDDSLSSLAGVNLSFASDMFSEEAEMKRAAELEVIEDASLIAVKNGISAKFAAEMAKKTSDKSMSK